MLLHKQRLTKKQLAYLVLAVEQINSRYHYAVCDISAKEHADVNEQSEEMVLVSIHYTDLSIFFEIAFTTGILFVDQLKFNNQKKKK